MQLNPELMASGWSLQTSAPTLGGLFRSNGYPHRLLVTFDQLSAFNHGRARVSGDRIAVRCEADHLHLSTSEAGWFQAPEIFDVLPVMQTICERYDEVLLYGQSMGGYGALLFSGPLKATNVVAFAPQFSVDPLKVPFETRFGAYVPNISFVFDDMLMSASQTAPKHVVYDPYTDIDKRHVDLIAGCANFIPVPVPFSGHLPGQVMKEGGCVSDIVVNLLLANGKGQDNRRMLRAGRRKSPRYFLERAFHFGQRKRLKEALANVSIAYVLDPDNIAIIETLSCILMADTAFYGTAHAMVRLILKERPEFGHYKGTRDLIWRELQSHAAPVVNRQSNAT